jgi:hypothetical protein
LNWRGFALDCTLTNEHNDYTYNSPYNLQENKFGLGVELEGKELKEFVTGAAEAFLTDQGTLDGKVKNSNNLSSSDYKSGLKVGHTLAAIAGIYEVADGIKNAAYGIAAEAPTLGLSTVAVLAGAAEVGIGLNSFKNAYNNLNSEGGTNGGRSGKQQRLKELGDDPKVSSSDRGWIKNEERHIKTGNRKTIRNPRNSRNSKGRGTELAHSKGKRAKDGHSYKDAKLQDADLHKLEHKHEGYK